MINQFKNKKKNHQTKWLRRRGVVLLTIITITKFIYQHHFNLTNTHALFLFIGKLKNYLIIYLCCNTYQNM